MAHAISYYIGTRNGTWLYVFKFDMSLSIKMLYSIMSTLNICPLQFVFISVTTGII